MANEDRVMEMLAKIAGAQERCEIKIDGIEKRLSLLERMVGDSRNAMEDLIDRPI